jgi:hypothetical protein
VPADRAKADSGATGARKLRDAEVEERLRTPKPERPAQPAVPEINGPKGPEPTRYGDWEKGGRCTDF